MLEIRVATQADLPGILALYAQPDFDDGLVLEIDQAQAIFARMSRYPAYKLYLAVEDAQIVGTFALLIMDNLGHRGTPSAIVEDVVVDAARQGGGIGRQMMHYALERSREAGCYKLVLSSNLKREAAHRFYDSLGFKRHGYSFLMELEVVTDQKID